MTPAWGQQLNKIPRGRWRSCGTLVQLRLLTDLILLCMCVWHSYTNNTIMSNKRQASKARVPLLRGAWIVLAYVTRGFCGCGVYGILQSLCGLPDLRGIAGFAGSAGSAAFVESARWDLLRLRGLRSLRGLRGLRSLSGLRGLRNLWIPRSLRGLWGSARFAGVRAVGSVCGVYEVCVAEIA